MYRKRGKRQSRPHTDATGVARGATKVHDSIFLHEGE